MPQLHFQVSVSRGRFPGLTGGLLLALVLSGCGGGHHAPTPDGGETWIGPFDFQADPEAGPFSRSVDAPTLVAPVDGSVLTAPTDLEWNRVAGATRYQVSLQLPTGRQGLATRQGASLSLAGVWPFLADGRYRWKVRGRDATGWGPWSEEWSWDKGSAVGEVGSISGRVTERYTGEPISGATVVVQALYTGITRQTVLPWSREGEGAGSYRITDLPPGTYLVTAAKAGYVSDPGSARSGIVVQARQERRNVNLTLTADWNEFSLLVFQDQWPLATPRWRDVGDYDYSEDFRNEFQYAEAGPGSVTLRYDPTPEEPYFVGAVKAEGLKPNFFYQLKLMGKPEGLWPGEGDRATNELIGRMARWWHYGEERVVDNFSDDTEYDRLPAGEQDFVAGYLYFGGFATDENGNTDRNRDGQPDFLPIAANRCYHITGKTGQEGLIGQDEVWGLFDFTRGVYGYGSPGPPDSVELWYEAERDDPLEVTLPPGDYDLILMITEESFHHSGLGGYWRSVLVSDWTTGVSPVSGLPWVEKRGHRLELTVG